MNEIVIVLSAIHAASLGSVRTFPGLLVARDGGKIWVRGIPVGKTDKKLAHLPVLHTWFIDEQDRLFAPNAITPSDSLPSLQWESLLSFIKVTLPVSALPGVLPKPQTVTLARQQSTVIITAESSALLTSFEIWESYVNDAPQIRLQHLYFAVSGNGDALIIGAPLAPVQGKAYTLNDNILLPAGYDFDPPAINTLVASTLNPANDSLLLFHQNGHWEKIKLDCFVPATRSAVRLTNSMI